MTIQGAINLADQMRPNSMATALKIQFLNELEQMIHGELIMKHAHTQEEETTPEYTEDTDTGTELLIPSPYDKVYWMYINHRIDLQNQEMDKYNNDRALFEHAYQEAADWINRSRPSLTSLMRIRL